jgi:hypothetical protein
MDKNPSEILIILFDAVIKLSDVSLVQKTKHLFLELAAAFAWNDLNEIDLSFKCFLNDTVELRIDLVTAVVNIVQVELKLCHSLYQAGNQTGDAGSI